MPANEGVLSLKKYMLAMTKMALIRSKFWSKWSTAKFYYSPLKVLKIEETNDYKLAQHSILSYLRCAESDKKKC